MSEETTDKVVNKDTGETVTEETPDVEETVNEGPAAEAPEEEAAGTAEETESGGEAASEDSSRKSRAEKKAEKKAQKTDKEKEALKAKVEELEDKTKRQLAEFENFRNRSEKEKAQSFDRGAASVLEKLLPVVDNFERGFAAVEEEDKDDAFVVGMDKIYKQLMDELDKMGVKPIEAVGKEFDPAFHNAVMQTESDEYESGYVAQELLKGYTYHDTVLRHSMVSVVQ
ncbi:MAG: nucleotide exchange factor GrpE [Lachnospiraceae bacterium]|nr:nucleotide exchange factor GrpE [Lachnospiraceae bacterium]MBP5253655.1 nucleotide exchange factor GrpE [Lachnospiraceae bacterium]MBP5701582.1 nucleotide exchange factor GrpE [Lachnospiraceae bacterium]